MTNDNYSLASEQQALLDHFVKIKGRLPETAEELAEFAGVEGNAGRLPGWDDETCAHKARLSYIRYLMDLFTRRQGREPRSIVEFKEWVETESNAGRLPGMEDFYDH